MFSKACSWACKALGLAALFIVTAAPHGGGGGGGGISSCTGGTAVSHQWLNSLSSGCAATLTQPACGDLSNAATSCSTDATNASNISSGALAIARGGTGGTVALDFWSEPPCGTSVSAAAFANSANTMNFWPPIMIPAPGVSFSNFTIHIGTNDAAHHYDIGLYTSSGAFVADSGQLTNTGSGVQSYPILVNASCTGSGTPSPCCTGSGTGTCPASPLTLAPGRYFPVTTGDSTTATINACNNANGTFVWRVVTTTQGSTTNGILASSITPPSKAVADTSQFYLHLSLN